MKRSVALSALVALDRAEDFFGERSPGLDECRERIRDLLDADDFEPEDDTAVSFDRETLSSV